MLAERKDRERARMPIPVDEPHVAYFGSRMHDSWPVEVERTTTQFRLTLNSIEGGSFAGVLSSLLEVEVEDDVWPVDLILHDPVYVRAARYGPEGELRFADWENIGKPVGEHVLGYQFLYDWFHQQDGRLQWIAEIWGGIEWRSKWSSSLFLMVDATRASAVDRRREAMVKAFGEAAGVLWDELKNEPYSVYYGGALEDFLVRRMRHYGWTASDFELDLGG